MPTVLCTPLSTKPDSRSTSDWKEALAATTALDSRWPVCFPRSACHQREAEPRYDDPFVVKTFDPRHSICLRQEYSLGEFDREEILEDVAESIWRGFQAAFEHDMTDSYSPSQKLSEGTQEIRSGLTQLFLFGDIYGHGSADELVDNQFGREAAARFETLMTSAGYADGQVVVAANSLPEPQSRD
ncbi:uncharacterized protein Z519_06967 [Cladophialophora bantiana CBS 173.52]|uniref:Uncharacterized protein n=1 Tax=Cladophialophora bantiana (strain ATCC 10958 / CBS 173.52 / CDC B-1940 / NIH 8579) TaxID=1442370 RepID=A0A0D2HMJ0_CLAB1|nr:uncharacterized protein Z519_06967 [Cladophialophora bantiana CBS 173.52]KIW91985.1 hypothetical protein Z519_06967 [Cladophialophora bantiana CBS 173.52]